MDADPRTNVVVFQLNNDANDIVTGRAPTLADDGIRQAWEGVGREREVRREDVAALHSEWEPSPTDVSFIKATFPQAAVTFNFSRPGPDGWEKAFAAARTTMVNAAAEELAPALAANGENRPTGDGEHHSVGARSRGQAAGHVRHPTDDSGHAPASGREPHPTSGPERQPATGRDHQPTGGHQPTGDGEDDQTDSQKRRPTDNPEHPSTTGQEHHPTGHSGHHMMGASENRYAADNQDRQPADSPEHPPTTTQEHRSSGDSGHQPTGNSEHQPTTSEEHQPTDGTEHRRTTPPGHQPASKSQPADHSQHSASHKPQPTDRAERPPTTAQEHQPANGSSSQPADHGQHPGASHEPQPTDGAERPPATGQEHQPASNSQPTDHNQHPGTTHKPQPTDRAERPPATGQEHQPASNSQPTDHNQHPGTTHKPQPTDRAERPPATGQEHQPASNSQPTDHNQHPGTSHEHQPTDGAERRPAIAQERRPSGDSGQRPASGDEHLAGGGERQSAGGSAGGSDSAAAGDGELLPVLWSESSPRVGLLQAVPHWPVAGGRLHLALAVVAPTPRGTVGVYHVTYHQLGGLSFDELMAEACLTLAGGLRVGTLQTDEGPLLSLSGSLVAAMVCLPHFYRRLSELAGAERLVVGLPCADEVYVAGSGSPLVDVVHRMVRESEHPATELVPSVLSIVGDHIEVVSERG